MSYTIVDDEGVLQVRAVLRTKKEFEELLEALNKNFHVLEHKESPSESGPA